MVIKPIEEKMTHYIFVAFLVFSLTCCSQNQDVDSSTARIDTLKTMSSRGWMNLKDLDSLIHSDTLTDLENEIYKEFLAPPAPQHVLDDLDSLFSDSLKNAIVETIDKSKYFQIDIDLRDSVIVEVFAGYGRNDISKELCIEIGKALIGHKPKYYFITKYNGYYAFVVDKHYIAKSMEKK